MSLDGLAYNAARQLARALMMSYENGYTFHGGAILLQAGDYGVRSIQSVTLGTLYVAGAISLIIARLIADVACSVANVPYKDTVEQTIYPGTCLVPIGLMNATTATVLNGSIGVRVD